MLWPPTAWRMVNTAGMNDCCWCSNGTCRLEDGTLAGVTLPQLEGVKRLARWSGQPAAAIWNATVAPEMIANAQSINSLIGQPLNTLLRWNQSGPKS